MECESQTPQKQKRRCDRSRRRQTSKPSLVKMITSCIMAGKWGREWDYQAVRCSTSLRRVYTGIYYLNFGPALLLNESLNFRLRNTINIPADPYAIPFPIFFFHPSSLISICKPPLTGDQVSYREEYPILGQISLNQRGKIIFKLLNQILLFGQSVCFHRVIWTFLRSFYLIVLLLFYSPDFPTKL